jgi:hypothetical protein
VNGGWKWPCGLRWDYLGSHLCSTAHFAVTEHSHLMLHAFSALARERRTDGVFDTKKDPLPPDPVAVSARKEHRVGLVSWGGPVVLAVVGLGAMTLYCWFTMWSLVGGRESWRPLLPSAIATALFWVGMEMVFSFIVSSTVISDDQKYGPIGGRLRTYVLVDRDWRRHHPWRRDRASMARARSVLVERTPTPQETITPGGAMTGKPANRPQISTG